MKRTQTSLNTLLRLSQRIVPFLLLLLALPMVIVVGFGLVSIYRQGYLLPFMLIVTACTFLASIPWWLMRRKVQQVDNATLQENWVTASTDWSEFDRQVWTTLNQTIDQQLKRDAAWSSLRSHALALVMQAAEQYHPARSRKEYAFTVPELLRMTEEVSRRYRQLLLQHVPLVEKLNLSTVRLVYDHRDKQETVQQVWNVFRFLRAFTPTGLLAEARGQLLDRLFSELKDEVQFKLKQAFLQEVASVAIDLYSGRFKVMSEDLSASDTFKTDQKRLAAPPEPLRVCLLGQVSAGKSSIVNALVGSMVAEVNQLPSTRQATVYQAQSDGVDTLHLVDLPGLDGSAATDQYLLAEITHCDVVLWVLKANQPARALDTAFKATLEAWFAEAGNRSRRKPLMIGVLNQVDRLTPVNEWAPPYALNPPETPKAKSISEALAYNRQLLGFELLIPLSVSEDKPAYNLEQLQRLLDENYVIGLQIQFNRRRLEAGDKMSVQEQFKRTYRMGKSLFRSLQAKNT